MVEMSPLETIQERLRQLMPFLSSRYQVKTLGIFGSYIRQEQREDSDLDLLVTFYDPPGLLKFIELENFLSDNLGIQVDLVMKEALKPEIGRRIIKEIVVV